MVTQAPAFNATPAQISVALGCAQADVAANWPTVQAALTAHGITSRNAIIAALATIGVEVPSFQPINEYGSADYFQRMYQGRADLGNTVTPTDGATFHGRGFIQLTGRLNYATYGERLGLDLVGNPDLALDPAIAADILALYFRDHNIPAVADAGDWQAVRRLVNGGDNNMEEFLLCVGLLTGLTPPPPPPPTPKISQKISAPYGAHLTKDCGLKAQPNHTCDALAHAPCGAQVTVLPWQAVTNGEKWQRVRWRDTEAWVPLALIGA